MYRENRSRVPGAFIWTSVPDGGATRVLPDGCMDLIWRDGDVLIAGPDTHAHLFPGRPGAVTVGVRFPPGMAPRLLGVPAYAVRDERVPLGAVWPARDARQLAERLAAGSDPGRLLEDAALQLVARADVGPGLVEDIVARVRDGRSVAAVAEAVGLSTRQLQRRCLDAFGYGAKTLLRILRMGRAVDLARAGVALADTAARAGYADQSHLARDVKELAGVPLGQLLSPTGSGANRSTEFPSGSWTTA